MLAEEAHYMGEPCWHVCQYYERKRQARLEANRARDARQILRERPRPRLYVVR